MSITPQTPLARTMLKSFVTGRSFVFVVSLVAPQRMLRALQIPGDGTPAPMILRMMGVRNGVLALGLSHLDQIRAPRRFVALNVVCDIVDVAAFIDAGRRKEISRTGAIVSTAVATSAVATGAVVYAHLPPDKN